MICTHCGYLQPPAVAVATTGSPMRRAVEVANRARSCPGCGQRAWGDPTLEAVALGVRPPGVPPPAPEPFGAHAVTVVGYVALFVGTVACLPMALTDLRHNGALAIALLIAIAALAFGLVLVLRGVRAPRRVAPHPARWHFATPGTTAVHFAVRGAVRPQGALLIAPLSGRPCVAYELGVRKDAVITAPDSSWELIEQRSVAFVVGTRRISADVVRLDLPRVRWRVGDHAGVVGLLEARAFAKLDAGAVFTETIVAPGDVLDLVVTEVVFGQGRGSSPVLRRVG